MAEGNFGFLKAHDPLLLKLAGDAEGYFTRDPNTCVFKLRQLGEAIAQNVAVTLGVWPGGADAPHQVDLLRDLQHSGYLDRDVAQLFHVIRKSGNRAAHEFIGQHRLAMDVLRASRDAAVWFHRTMGHKPQFKPGPFVPPEDPSKRFHEIEEEIAKMKMLAERQQHSVEEAQKLVEAERARAEENAALVELFDADRKSAEILAEESEAALESYRMRLSSDDHPRMSDGQREAHRHGHSNAGHDLDVAHEHTLHLIDHDLKQAGWEVDSRHLSYGRGARPAAERNLAIANWPTSAGEADYMLFLGLVPIAVVLASHQSSDLESDVTDVELHACGLLLRGDVMPAEPHGHRGSFSGWDAGADHFGHPRRFRMPFAFTSNGEDHHAESHESTGVWFRDLRSESEATRLHKWMGPAELEEKFAAAYG